MRGRKPYSGQSTVFSLYSIKKESPNEGTETAGKAGMYICKFFIIKKESPNEGAEKTMME